MPGVAELLPGKFEDFAYLTMGLDADRDERTTGTFAGGVPARGGIVKAGQERRCVPDDQLHPLAFGGRMNRPEEPGAAGRGVRGQAGRFCLGKA